VEYKILGTTLPVLEVTLQPQEWIVAESGELSWMTASIGLQSGVQVGGQAGGLFGAINRAISGSTIFMTQYYAYQYPGQVAFATKVPGTILPIEMPAGHPGYVVHRHGFLAGGPQIQLGVALQQRLGGDLVIAERDDEVVTHAGRGIFANPGEGDRGMLAQRQCCGVRECVGRNGCVARECCLERVTQGVADGRRERAAGCAKCVGTVEQGDARGCELAVQRELAAGGEPGIPA